MIVFTMPKTMTKRSFKYLIIGLILLSTTLVGCGYRLRNQHELPPQMQTLYLQSDNPYGEFATMLREIFLFSGISLVCSPEEAPVTLAIIDTRLNTITSNVGPTSQARVYTVTYTVIYALRNSLGQNLQAPQTIVVTNTLTLNPNQLLDSNNQLQIMEQELQREAINRLFNRLTSEQVLQILSCACY